MKCGCRSTHFAVVHPQKLMKHPWRTSDTVLVVRHGCSIHFCGCMTAKWVLCRPHFHTILHLWNRNMFLKLCPQLFAINSSWSQFWLFLKLLVGIYYMRLLNTHCKFKIWSQNKSESMDLDCEQLRARFQNKNLCQFEPIEYLIEYLRPVVSNLSKTKIAFILIKHCPFKQ